MWIFSEMFCTYMIAPNGDIVKVHGISSNICSINSSLTVRSISWNENTRGKYVQLAIDENNTIQFQTFYGNPNRLYITLRIDGEWGNGINLTT